MRKDNRGRRRAPSPAASAAAPSGPAPSGPAPSSPAPSARAALQPTRLRRRRDRRGRGVRGRLAPVAVPLSRTRGEQFDDLVMDAVDELEEHWGPELSGLEFAVEDVPPPGAPGAGGLDVELLSGLEPGTDTVFDRGVPLGRLFRDGLDDIREPVIVIYRRPVEARAVDPEDRADLVFMIVVDLTAEFLGRDGDEIDPPH